MAAENSENGFMSRERSIAPPGYNRWLIPPAALCIHLCIGQAYAFSVFNVPMTKLVGITKPGQSDWTIPELGWIFSLAILFLGISSAVFGRYVEEGGPRRAMFTAAFCWAGGFFVAALGVYMHVIWLTYLGYGVLGGIGLGIGYISPVSTLMKWFPDRPGMATGMAIMGFGGGAMIASPLSLWLMNKFSSPTHVGVAETFVCLGAIYFVFMVIGAFLVRLPTPDWKPENYTAPDRSTKKLMTTRDVHVYEAPRTPQFWLIWVVLCVNVTAGIGVLSQASKMSQDMLAGHVTAAAAGGFVGLLSLFNMGGRFFWASMSDYIGRRNTYFIFMVLGAVLYALVPSAASAGSVLAFVTCFLVLITMYGGGFATVPAYLRDIFGMRYVGAIHGLLLTAWSAAGIFGPVIVNYTSDYRIKHGVPKEHAYDTAMYIVAGLLVIGFICNLMISAVAERHYMKSNANQPAGAAA